MNRRLVTRLAAATAGLAALAAGGSALASAAHPSTPSAGTSALAHHSAARPATVAKPSSLQAQSNIPALDAPGSPQTVAYPPDNQVYNRQTVRVTAPPNTRIVGLDLQCNFPCPVTISADGQTATGRVEADNVHFIRPFYVQLQADPNAPLAGGRFSGTFDFAGVTRPLTVDITAGTQGSVAIFPSNAPSNGGVTVNFVMQGSEAANSGLQAGDVITAINGTPVTNLTTYNAALSGLRNGATVPIIVRRNGRFVNINLTLD